MTDSGETEPLDSWPRERLIERIRALEASLGPAPAAPSTTPTPTRKPKPARPFDFSKHACRPIALRIAYLGWSYHGLATQGIPTTSTTESGLPTVEGEVVKALLKARLIPSWHG
ncbi:hypothetical protein HDU96_009804, partial [Phlyctochytrium bullatum]